MCPIDGLSSDHRLSQVLALRGACARRTAESRKEQQWTVKCQNMPRYLNLMAPNSLAKVLKPRCKQLHHELSNLDKVYEIPKNQKPGSASQNLVFSGYLL